MRYKDIGNSLILRIDDNAIFPRDPENQDYIAFLAWQDAGGVLEPTYTIDEYKSMKAEALQRDFQGAINQGAPTSFGFKIACDWEDMYKFNNLKTFLDLTGMQETEIKDFDGNFQTIPTTSFYQVLVEGGVYFLTQYKKVHSLIAATNACTSYEQIDQVTW